ncbi:MAG: AAA family ATPase [Bacteroidota bacterium]
MPITKFKHIKNLAVFLDFDWDRSLRDEGNNIVTFNPINIFYGRNYSGKTTLSRIIRALETGKISEKYENPEFSVSIQGESDANQINLTGHNKKIRVFNEDFVKDNLRFISNSDENIIPFAILGGNTSLEEEIAKLNNELGNSDEESPTGFYLELSNARKNYTSTKNRHKSAIDQLDKQLSQKAINREIGIKYKPERFGDQNYTKTKLENDIKTVLVKDFQPISNIEQERLLKLLDEKPNNTIPTIQLPVFSFDKFITEANKLISQSISESGKIEQLVKDSILNRWVKEGKNIHKGQLEDCAFCGNEITSARWADIDRHFDEESEKLTQSIELLIDKIDKEISFSETTNIQKDYFYSKFHTKIDQLEILYSRVVSFYINSLYEIKSQLISRKDDIINSRIFNAPRDYSGRLLWIYQIYENIRNSSNQYTNKLSSDQNNAKISLRLREVYDFTATIQYINECASIAEIKIELDEKEITGKGISNKIQAHLKLIEDKQRLMNDEEKGALKVNEYLNNYFGHDFLALKAIEEEDPNSKNKKIRFEIIRNNKKAHHLSEGECSLIAFCYFMAKLEDIETKGSKPIIWIDDPISSLDANHIFFIYSLINSEIVSRKEFEQLFISTHNLDFLKYLKRLPGASNKNESKYFIINREHEQSTIKLMPRYLKDYVTEFNYLFHQIYICANADLDDEQQHFVFYNFANNTRKFLEAFLFYKYPNAIEKDDKLLRFFGDNKQASAMTDRINNEYSHLEGIFERSMIPVDVPEMKKIASFVLKRIEDKDKEQFEALLKSIEVEIAE